MKTSNKLIIIAIILSIATTTRHFYQIHEHKKQATITHKTNRKSRSVRTAFHLSQNKRIDKKLWKNFIRKADKYILSENLDYELLNNMAWYVFENYKNHDVSALESAKYWSEKTIEYNPNGAHYLDTYACILFDLDFVDDAIKHQEKAVELLKRKNHKWLDDYQERLDKFKSHQKE